jgi:hypothetical protein
MVAKAKGENGKTKDDAAKAVEGAKAGEGAKTK